MNISKVGTENDIETGIAHSNKGPYVHPDWSAERYIAVILFPPIIVLGTVGNAIAVVVLCQKAFVTNYMAVALRLMSILDIIILWGNVTRYAIIEIADFDLRNISQLVCRLHLSFCFWVGSFNNWVLTTITFLRYAAVRFPFKARDLKPKKVRQSCLAIALINIAYHVGIFFLDSKLVTIDEETYHAMYCTYVFTKGRLVVKVSQVVMEFVVPTILLVVFNILLLKALEKQRVKKVVLVDTLKTTAGMDQSDKLFASIGKNALSKERGQPGIIFEDHDLKMDSYEAYQTYEQKVKFVPAGNNNNHSGSGKEYLPSVVNNDCEPDIKLQKWVPVADSWWKSIDSARVSFLNDSFWSTNSQSTAETKYFRPIFSIEAGLALGSLASDLNSWELPGLNTVATTQGCSSSLIDTRGSIRAGDGMSCVEDAFKVKNHIEKDYVPHLEINTNIQSYPRQESMLHQLQNIPHSFILAQQKYYGRRRVLRRAMCEPGVYSLKKEDGQMASPFCLYRNNRHLTYHGFLKSSKTRNGCCKQKMIYSGSPSLRRSANLDATHNASSGSSFVHHLTKQSNAPHVPVSINPALVTDDCFSDYMHDYTAKRNSYRSSIIATQKSKRPQNQFMFQTMQDLIKQEGSTKGQSETGSLTAMIILASMVQVLFNLPWAVFYIVYGVDLHMSKTSLYEHHVLSTVFALFQHILVASNFLLYSVSGSKFQTELKKLFKKTRNKECCSR